MIYIFSAVESVCSLPGYLCSACGDACKACPSVCSACGGACKSVGKDFKHFMGRPLCGYVVVSLLVSAFQLRSAYEDMQTPRGCESTYLGIVMGFSVFNILFAFYVQRLVWWAIMERDNHHLFLDGDNPSQSYHVAGAAGGLAQQAKGALGDVLNKATGAAGDAERQVEHFDRKEGKIIIPTRVVQESFRKVFMENLAVLGMFLLLIGMMALSYTGPEAVDDPGEGCRVSVSTRNCGYPFFLLPAVWSFMYLKCNCCANKVTISKEEMQSYDEGYQYVDSVA